MPKYRRMPGQPIEAVQWNLADGDIFKAEDWPMVQFDHGSGRNFIETMHAGQREPPKACTPERQLRERARMPLPLFSWLRDVWKSVNIRLTE